MEIKQDPPKALQYSILLHTKFGNGGFFRNLARRFKGKEPNKFTKSEIKEFLQSHYQKDCSTSISNYLQQLEKDEIMQKKGTIENQNGMKVDTWKIDKEKLEKEVIKTDFMAYFTGEKKGFKSKKGDSFLKKIYYGHPYKD